MRWSDVARDVLASASLVLVVLDACPLLLGLIVLDSAPLALPELLELPEVDGLALAPLVAPLVASFAVPLPDVPVGLPEPLVDGRLSSTSPLDVPVVVAFGEVLPVLGTQFVALVVARAAEAEVSLVDGVVPVPLAPFVVFSPVKRWSGFVAVLLAESVRAAPVTPVVAVPEVVPEVVPAAPDVADVADVAPAPIVDPVE